MDSYAKVRDSDRLVLTLDRGGQPVTLTVTLVADPAP